MKHTDIIPFRVCPGLRLLLILLFFSQQALSGNYICENSLQCLVSTDPENQDQFDKCIRKNLACNNSGDLEIFLESGVRGLLNHNKLFYLGYIYYQEFLKNQSPGLQCGYKQLARERLSSFLKISVSMSKEHGMLAGAMEKIYLKQAKMMLQDLERKSLCYQPVMSSYRVLEESEKVTREYLETIILGPADDSWHGRQKEKILGLLGEMSRMTLLVSDVVSRITYATDEKESALQRMRDARSIDWSEFAQFRAGLMPELESLDRLVAEVRKDFELQRASDVKVSASSEQFFQDLKKFREEVPDPADLSPGSGFISHEHSEWQELVNTLRDLKHAMPGADSIPNRREKRHLKRLALEVQGLLKGLKPGGKQS